MPEEDQAPETLHDGGERASTVLPAHVVSDGIMSDRTVELVVDGISVPISRDMYEYIKFEASRRGVSEVEIYREEMRAEVELKDLKPPLDRLEKASQKDYGTHPWLAGNQEKPF